MIKDYFQLAFSNLSHRRLRSWLTMIGIFIGIAAVVSLIGLGEGLRIAVLSQFGFLGTDVLGVQAKGLEFAGPPGTGVTNPLSDELVDKIQKVPGVDVAYNRHLKTARVEFNDRQDIEFLASVPSGNNRRALEEMLNIKPFSGRLLKEGDNKKVVLGYEFSDENGFYRKAVKSGDRILINGETFEVVGILEKKGSFILDDVVLINDDPFLELFGDDGTTELIAIRIKDEKEIDKVVEDLEKLMRKERDVDEGEEDFIVESPQETLDNLNSTLFAVQLFVYIIALVSLVVGGIGIMNTMYTAVIERTKEIGIMKAIGARNSTIFLLFFIESGFLGLVGGIIGVLLGVSLAYGFSFMGQLALGSDLIQASVTMPLIMGTLIFSFVLGTVFGVLPALRAAKLQPVDALRSK